MKKKILVVGQYFYPEQFRINDICEQWVNMGYSVEVVSGTPNYPQGNFYDGYGLFKKTREKHKGIKIFRIPQIPRGSSSFMLSLNYLSFVASGFIWSKVSRKKADCVFNYSTSPILHALPGIWFAKRKKIPFYIYILDMWPQSFETMTHIHFAPILKALHRICDYIYDSSEKIFVPSKGYIQPLLERGVSKDKIIYWPQYAEEYYKPLNPQKVHVPEIPHDDKFNIVFAGNIGYAQGLEILPEVAKYIKRNNDKLRLCIVGDGRYKSHLLEEIKEAGVEDVFCFVDRQPATRIPEFMSVCDAALITLQNTDLFSLTIPAKVQSCMACGIPIVLAVDGVAREVIDEAECGLTCPSSDAKALYETMIEIADKSEKELKEMRKNALDYFEKNFEKNLLMKKMDEYINNKDISLEELK